MDFEKIVSTLNRDAGLDINGLEKIDRPTLCKSITEISLSRGINTPSISSGELGTGVTSSFVGEDIRQIKRLNEEF